MILHFFPIDIGDEDFNHLSLSSLMPPLPEYLFDAVRDFMQGHNLFVGLITLGKRNGLKNIPFANQTENLNEVECIII
jgi:hypothetical protein